MVNVEENKQIGPRAAALLCMQKPFLDVSETQLKSPLFSSNHSISNIESAVNPSTLPLHSDTASQMHQKSPQQPLSVEVSDSFGYGTLHHELQLVDAAISATQLKAQLLLEEFADPEKVRSRVPEMTNTEATKQPNLNLSYKYEANRVQQPDCAEDSFSDSEQFLAQIDANSLVVHQPASTSQQLQSRTSVPPISIAFSKSPASSASSNQSFVRNLKKIKEAAKLKRISQQLSCFS